MKRGSQARRKSLREFGYQKETPLDPCHLLEKGKRASALTKTFIKLTKPVCFVYTLRCPSGQQLEAAEKILPLNAVY